MIGGEDLHLGRGSQQDCRPIPLRCGRSCRPTRQWESRRSEGSARAGLALRDHHHDARAAIRFLPRCAWRCSEDAEKISGVTVVGKYTDSLGRTGIALRQGSSDTQVIDTGNGQVLTDIQPAQAHRGAPPSSTNLERGQGSASALAAPQSPPESLRLGGATLFISADATNSEPHVNQPTPYLTGAVLTGAVAVRERTERARGPRGKPRSALSAGPEAQTADSLR